MIIIVGPTAIGKTALSIQLAQYFNSEILSCDSRQFFKKMNIGTAVPSTDELAQASHHFIQHISINDKYSVGDFEQEALQVLDNLFLKNSIQILVGGSGLYVDAVVKGFDDFPTIEPSVRTYINETFEKEGIAFLQEKLAKLDPIYEQKLALENPQTLQNPQRMKRFVEVCIGTGKPYSSFLNQNNNPRNFIPIFIGLEAPREVLYNRINQRVDLMIENGLVEEARKLYPQKHLNALQTVGYRELFDYFDEKTPLHFAIEEIKKNTRRFAKRQLTWFKRNEKIQWFDYQEDINNITDTIELKIKNRNDSFN